MKSFDQMRLEYLTKAREAQIRAVTAADPKTIPAWQFMAMGYAELAAECDHLLGYASSLSGGIAA
jgi:hypothetical protein